MWHLYVTDGLSGFFITRFISQDLWLQHLRSCYLDVKANSKQKASHLLSLSPSSHQVDNTTPSTIEVFISNHVIPVAWGRKLIFFSAIGRKLLVKADFFLLWVLFNSNVCINVLVADVAGPRSRPKAGVSKWKSEIIHFTVELVHMRRRSNTWVSAFSTSHTSAFPCSLAAFSAPAAIFHLSLLWSTELLLRGSCRPVGKGQSTTLSHSPRTLMVTQWKLGKFRTALWAARNHVRCEGKFKWGCEITFLVQLMKSRYLSKYGFLFVFLTHKPQKVEES